MTHSHTTPPTPISQAYVKFNHDFSQAVVIKGGDIPFTPTPMVGVERMMFERIGDEVARRATSCVRYQAGSQFSAHVHSGGEEYLVLRGTFSDESGDFPQGWYVRNPVGSRHAPFTHEGCEILVKLAQMPVDETANFSMDTQEGDWALQAGGMRELTLWQSAFEHTSLRQLPSHYQGEPEQFDEVFELFVIAGDIRLNEHQLGARSWLRLPAHHPIAMSSVTGATVYIKIGKGVVRE
ncbi:cupin domain-containing protein [Shewanella sp. NIFS-20-20]|uniref:cupin domain-containing protein n=1 Tax=Shewanella sp. NIFS-20-20 TaxID=2853806 RepID=UPI001C44D6AF|nr:cupin domain-containing protein [Shewanella sp. NIFS-20-20]MBV7316373.1 cupin domain-containing protein [Shewanella sp. NIFS-20-20]